jgi:hypothetical protein
LLLDPQVVFPGDWRNHLWMIGHYGEHFRQHGDMPTALNFSAGVGIAQPVFYGYLLYPLLGLLSSAVGANVALRLGVALLLVVQFVALISAGNRIFGLRRIAYFVGVSMAVATYSLTNLFNRGAIPEFFGVGFFVTAVAWAVTAAVAVEANRQIFFGWLAVVFLVLALGAHPPTTVVASATVAALGLGAAGGWWRDRGFLRPGSSGRSFPSRVRAARGFFCLIEAIRGGAGSRRFPTTAWVLSWGSTTWARRIWRPRSTWRCWPF